MIVNKQTKIFDAVSTTGSATISTFRSDTVSLQVDGTFTTLSMKIEGRLVDSNTWEQLSVVNLHGFAVSDTITAKGIYELGVEGIYELRATITTLTGTTKSVTVYAQSVNTGA